MTTTLCFTAAAEMDVAAVFAWYEEQREGLGRRFLDAADELFRRMRERPRLFPEVVRGYRRGLLHRFPYGVYFAFERDRVVVHAVLHLHRDPAVWRKRLSGGPG